ncbi:IclR family transcriptional regulator [Acuticoccus kandeliae]|uniref:IclR family transcriptional regulator n=1 Tax=Acuticoccus kandeliae TaxID=2073160 RepID=UPI000D3E09F3|nr:IclR family transcriptional regulator C-terminal domain-containing protein [Acuticoccus kandeliae]
MSGLRRFVDILKLFGIEQSDWTVQQISERLGVPASTVYRSVRELAATGFIEPSIEGHYRLGASFIEFDRLVRLTDPLVRKGTPLLADIVDQAQIPCVAVVARLYDSRVMCVADRASKGSTIHTSYERGLPRPLTLGATSKAILAQLQPRKLAKLIEHEDWSSRPGTAATSAEEFRKELAAIRKRGYCIGRGEVDEGLVGIAAPLSVAERAITGSLSLVVRASDVDASIERRLILLVVSSAGLLSDELRSDLP